MPYGHDRDIAPFAFDLALRQRDYVLLFRDGTEHRSQSNGDEKSYRVVFPQRRSE